MAGRGAWSSIGGTLNYDGDRPGPYYILATGDARQVGSRVVDANSDAVHVAVREYQQALRRRLGVSLADDGVFGPVTSRVVKDFQRLAGETADGAIGPKTSKSLIFPDIRTKVNSMRNIYPKFDEITPRIVCGYFVTESNFDVGAVGYQDEHDRGPVQINAQAHPEWTDEERQDPILCAGFVFGYLRSALQADGIETIDDAILSYNLGVGGTRTWIRAGRPRMWTPQGSTTPRDTSAYINKVKTGCA